MFASCLKTKKETRYFFPTEVETAYLLLEAAETLGIKDLQPILTLGKKMVDHA